jgi:hypothetical protein
MDSTPASRGELLSWLPGELVPSLPLTGVLREAPPQLEREGHQPERTQALSTGHKEAQRAQWVWEPGMPSPGGCCYNPGVKP